VDNKRKVTQTLVPMLKKLADPLESAHYTRILAQRLNVPEKTIYEMLAQVKSERSTSFGAGFGSGNTAKKAENAEAPVTPILKTKSYSLEQKLLGYALFGEMYRDEVLKQVSTEALSPEIAQLYQQLTDFIKQNPGEFNSDKFIDQLAAQSSGELIDPAASAAELAKMALFMVESEYHQLDNQVMFVKEFQKTLKEFLSIGTKLQMQNLISAMIAAEQKKDQPELDHLKAKFLELSQKLASI